MTGLVAVRTPIEHDTKSRSWFRRLSRVTWVQHRTGLISITLLFAAFAIVLLVTGQTAHHSYAQYLANSCLSPVKLQLHPAKCQTIWNTLLAQNNSRTNILMWTTRTVTLLAAIFLGVPLLSRELESGSYRFAWSQGVGRVRWALTKSGLLVVALMVVTAALSVALWWYLAPFNGARLTNHWIPDQFDITYLSLALWAGLAFFVSVLIGGLARKVIPAMASAMGTVAVLVFLVFIYLDKWFLTINARVFRVPVDEGYAPNLGTINEASSPDVAGPHGAWMLHGWITSPSGATLNKAQTFELMTRAETAVQGSNNPHAANVWLAAHHDAAWNTYQPAGHYWPLQLAYAAGLLVCLFLLVCATVSIVQRVGSGGTLRSSASVVAEKFRPSRSSGPHAKTLNTSDQSPRLNRRSYGTLGQRPHESIDANHPESSDESKKYPRQKGE